MLLNCELICLISGIILHTLVLSVDSSVHNRCKFQEFRCSDGSGCFVTEKLCNGVKDCANGEDETWQCSNVHLNKNCGDQHKYFTCRFGGCIRRNLVCNGNVDCVGGSDEASDFCVDDSGLKPVPALGGNKPSAPQSRPSAPQSRPYAPQSRPSASQSRPSASQSRPSASQSRPSAPQSRPSVSQSKPRPPFSVSIAPPRLRPRPIKTPPPSSRPVDSLPSRVNPSASSSDLSCRELEEEEGVGIQCYDSISSRRKIDCRGPVANGTVAVYKCLPHFNRPRNVAKTIKRLCRNGSWTRRRRNWHCFPDCGKGGVSSVQLVVGGYTSTIGKWPWHVGLYRQDPPNSGKWKYFCGGTLISTKAVITAAHCLRKPDGRIDMDLRLFFGKYYRDINKNDQYVQERKPLDLKIHEYYDSITFKADIGMILFDPVELTDRVKVVCLPVDGDNQGLEAGDYGTVVGWGRYEGNRYPQELQEARIPVQSFKTCQRAHPTLEALVRSDTFCAGYRNGTSPCDGDSGGGFVEQDISNKWTIYGVISAGVAKRGGGCDSKYYTVFTKIVSFRGFIDNVIDHSLRKRRRSLTNKVID